MRANLRLCQTSVWLSILVLLLACGPVIKGAAIDTHAAGTRPFTVHATDIAGNSSSTSVAYHVECDHVSLGLSPSTVVAGDVVRIAASLRSCSANAQTIALRF